MATPPTLTVAIFAELPPDQTNQRWVGVAGWTDTGRRYYLPATQVPPPQPDDRPQLTALTQTLSEPPTSCGRGWKTWVLESPRPPSTASHPTRSSKRCSGWPPRCSHDCRQPRQGPAIHLPGARSVAAAATTSRVVLATGSIRHRWAWR
jgi:hypothetical protein